LGLASDNKLGDRSKAAVGRSSKPRSTLPSTALWKATRPLQIGQWDCGPAGAMGGLSPGWPAWEGLPSPRQISIRSAASSLAATLARNWETVCQGSSEAWTSTPDSA